MITSTDSNTETRFTSIHIECNAIKGEIVTTVKHLPETYRIGDASDNRTDERVTIEQRSFPVYSRTPGAACIALARSMRAEVAARLPSVPVSLYGA